MLTGGSFLVTSGRFSGPERNTAYNKNLLAIRHIFMEKRFGCCEVQVSFIVKI